MTKHVVSSNTIPVEWFDKFCTDQDAVKLFHVERNNLLCELEEACALIRELRSLVHCAVDLDSLCLDIEDAIDCTSIEL